VDSGFPNVMQGQLTSVMMCDPPERLQFGFWIERSIAGETYLKRCIWQLGCAITPLY
jgi:hypothetical protein